MSLAPPPGLTTGVCAAPLGYRVPACAAAHPVDPRHHLSVAYRSRLARALTGAAATGWCWICFTRRVSPIRRPQKSTPHCWMKRRLPLLDPHDVSAAGPAWRSSRTASAVASSRLPETRIAGPKSPTRSGRGDITKLMGPTRVVLFLSLRDPGYLSAGGWSAGASRMLKAPRCFGRCSRTRSPNTTCHESTHAARRSRRA